MRENDWVSRTLRWFVSILAALTISSMVLNVTFTSGKFNIEDRANLQKMIQGTAHRPFIYRAMTPLTIRTLTHLTPDFLRQKMEKLWLERKLYEAFSMPQEYPVEGIWTYLVMMTALIGFFLILRLLVLEFYGLPDLVAVLLALVGLACIPLFRIWFIYDLPNLFIFSTCLLLMARQNWKQYYPVFLIACFTKETSVLLPFIFFVSHQVFTGSKRAWFVHVAVQSAIWAVIFLGLRLNYQSNPGHFLEFHLLTHNLPLLWRDPCVFLVINKYLMPGQLNFLILTFLGFFVFRNWSEKPLFLRRALLMLIPMLVSALLFGVVEETRSYLEIYPVLLLLSLGTMVKVFRFEFESEPVVTRTSLR